MYHAAGELGVRTDVPFKDLSEKEKAIVYHGKEVEKLIVIPSKNGKMFDLNVKYRNAHQAIVEALKGAKTEKGLNKINQFLSVQTCPECHGSRLNKRANSTLLNGLTLSQVSSMTLEDLADLHAAQLFVLEGDVALHASVTGRAQHCQQASFKGFSWQEQ